MSYAPVTSMPYYITHHSVRLGIHYLLQRPKLSIYNWKHVADRLHVNKFSDEFTRYIFDMFLPSTLVKVNIIIYSWKHVADISSHLDQHIIQRRVHGLKV